MPFMNFQGAAAAADLGIGANPALSSDLTEEQMKKRKKQLSLLDQAKSGSVGQPPGMYGAASLSLIGK
jgi:PBP1b-binding outer membrane lipoprotein LpoB